MKTSFQKIIAAAFAVIIISSFLFSCKKDKDDEPDLIKRTTATFSGASETPAIPSSGTGTAVISYDQGTKVITYTLTWQLGLATDQTVNMHFHGAADGDDTHSSGVVIPITGFSTGSSGTLSGSTRALSQEEENQLLAGRWYVNIHSSTYPGGELRANIKFSSSSNGGGVIY